MLPRAYGYWCFTLIHIRYIFLKLGSCYFSFLTFLSVSHWFYNYLLCTCYVPGILLDSRDKVMNNYDIFLELLNETACNSTYFVFILQWKKVACKCIKNCWIHCSEISLLISVHENSIFTELGTHNFLKIQSAGPVFLFE